MRGMSVFILTRRAITSRSSLFKKNPDNGRNLVMLLEHLVTPLEYSPPRGVLSSLQQEIIPTKAKLFSLMVLPLNY